MMDHLGDTTKACVGSELGPQHCGVKLQVPLIPHKFNEGLCYCYASGVNFRLENDIKADSSRPMSNGFAERMLHLFSLFYLEFDKLRTWKCSQG